MSSGTPTRPTPPPGGPCYRCPGEEAFMAEPVKKLEAEALKLAENERAELARVLLLSLGDSQEQEVEQAWAEEAERRYQELKTGAVEGLPSDDVLEEARSRLK